MPQIVHFLLFWYVLVSQISGYSMAVPSSSFKVSSWQAMATGRLQQVAGFFSIFFKMQ
jgi:hypothetical protein